FSPVLGLRPTRPRRSRVRKLPKPRISIFSPFCKAPMMLSNMVSTIVSDSLRGSSVTFKTSSIRSALVSVDVLCLVISLCLVAQSRNGLPKRSEEHTSELQSLRHLVCRLLLEKKKIIFCYGVYYIYHR